MSTDTRQRDFCTALATAAACLVIGLASLVTSPPEAEATRPSLRKRAGNCGRPGNGTRPPPSSAGPSRLDPKKADAWNGLGWASFNSGKLPEAEKAFQSAVALDPNQSGALNGLGQLYLAQKKYDLAETYLLKASPHAPAAWYGLARLYLLQGKYDKAEEWAGKLVDSGQGDEIARRMLKAARAKNVPDGLRIMIEPQPLAGEQSPQNSPWLRLPAVADWRA